MQTLLGEICKTCPAEPSGSQVALGGYALLHASGSLWLLSRHWWVRQNSSSLSDLPHWFTPHSFPTALTSLLFPSHQAHSYLSICKVYSHPSETPGLPPQLSLLFASRSCKICLSSHLRTPIPILGYHCLKYTFSHFPYYLQLKYKLCKSQDFYIVHCYNPSICVHIKFSVNCL